MSGWKCLWCGQENDPALGVCESCKVVRGERVPGHPEVRAYIPRKGEVRKLRKDHPDLDVRTAEAVLADIRAERSSPPRAKPRIKWVPEDQRHLLEVDLFDLHMGKLAWGEETGENYDTRIATDRAHAAVDDLLAQASPYPVERILLPWGNDLLQYDNLIGTTTAGTPQDRDSRYQLMYRRTFHLSRLVVERCAEVAPVHVMIVPGNHDEQSAFTMGVAIEAYFHADPRVTVDNSPKPFKHYRYGSTLLGFNHGKDMPAKRLAQMLPVLAREEWGHVHTAEVHCGHWHKSKVVDPISVDGESGVRVRFLRSLSGTDSYHARHGFMGEQAGAEAYVWNHARGLRANFVSTALRQAA